MRTLLHIGTWAMVIVIAMLAWWVKPSGASSLSCEMPELDIPKTEACNLGRVYPECKWQIPEQEQAEGLYVLWERTPPAERWGSPTLVKLALKAAYAYTKAYPGERLTVGDLDAPPDQHKTHNRGMDMDLYLRGSMLSTVEGGGNYRSRSTFEQRMLRARVFDLAKILAQCAQGQIRIYYNDEVVMRWFNPWFWARGWRPPFGQAMVAHNHSHDYHMHVTVLRPETRFLAITP
ncbi:MAG: hypothetical protein IPJ88_14455 [Myxococcales bacterium]|nr:MAG: hypothetical protein IPJ88_14455 [Myxococcales bacterium]